MSNAVIPSYLTAETWLSHTTFSCRKAL